MFFNEQIQEDKEYKQSCYGGYCSLCKKNNITPVSYTDFNIEYWNKIKKELKKEKAKMDECKYFLKI